MILFFKKQKRRKLLFSAAFCRCYMKNLNKSIEILAPVGGDEQLVAAVRSGTDAVYFGASSFNARRNAKNFTDEEFIAAVKYCHERGVKAYITLNTIFKDSEKDSFLNTLKLIAKSGADAVILQDMGAAKAVKECCPSLPMHASTQMAVHNLSGAQLLAEAGFSRIVLARELSFREIEKITKNTDAEIEVFVHGAHCMSASGMCYMSSILGGRSGNRGLCAQPCRLNFRTDTREYALSLKDMCLADETERLIEAGVSSLKIEGRMKRPEYVSSCVRAYKTALSGEKPDIFLLQSVFSRSGFTKGYFEGKRNLSMFGYRTKEDVLSASPVLKDIENTYRNENPLIEVSMDFTVKAGKPALLVLSDGVFSVTAEGKIPEKAEKLPLTTEGAVRNLEKLGSTFYYASDITCHIDDGLMLRASDINALRRDACEKLTLLRGKTEEHSFCEPKKRCTASRENETTKIWLQFRKASLMPQNLCADRVILPIDEISDEILNKYKSCLAVYLPALIYPASEEAVVNSLIKLREKGVEDAVCDNIGAVALAKKAGMRITGGALLNVLNSDSLSAYRGLGVSHMILSPEISSKEIRNLSTTVKTGIIAYGYLPLMHFRCCPLQGRNGCEGCSGKGSLTDRMGEKFKVLCEKKQYSVLYNTVPLYLGDKAVRGLSFSLLKFTDESPAQAEKIIHAFTVKGSLDGRKTAGLFERELL